MKFFFSLLFSFLFLFYSQQVFSNQTIIVTASKLKSLLEKTGSSSIVIEVNDSLLKRYKDVASVVKDQAGIEVFNSGGIGKTSSLFIRGTNSEHTLVLIDGIEANDPMGATRAFDFGRLQLSDIERIEIVKGAQSLVHGSDALGGVIQIITKKGQGKTKAILNIEGGSFQTFKTHASVSGKSDFTDFHLSGTQITTQGYSAANEKDGNSERDGHKQKDISLRLGKDLHTKVSVDFITKYTEAQTDIDQGGGPNKDDPNFINNTNQLFSKIQGTIGPFNDNLEFIAGFSWAQTNRRSVNTNANNFFRADLIKTFLQSNYYLDSSQTLSTGIEYEEESGRSNKANKNSTQTKGIHALYNFEQNSFFATAGIRYDEHSAQNVNAFTYKISPGFFIEPTGTTFRANLGKAFKSPSLFQLFDPNFGNDTLKPEEVISWDVGIKQDLLMKKNHRSFFEVTYFRNDFKNLMSSDPTTFKTINLGESITQGVESSFYWQPLDFLKFKANYTHLIKFETKSTGINFVRRPRNSWFTSINYQINSNLGFILDYRYIGRRIDFDATNFSRKNVPSFGVFNFLANYSWKKDQSIYLKIENLLDKEYEEVDGFATPGFSTYLGLRSTL